jgi:hypothetical protein
LTSDAADLAASNFTDLASSVRIRRLVDAYEPDDTCGQASELRADGTAQHRTFHSGNSADWASLYAVAGTTYTVRTLNLGPLADTMLTLYRADCATQIGFDDDGGGGRASQIVWTADSTGWIYIQVRSFNDATGPGRFYDLQRE